MYVQYSTAKKQRDKRCSSSSFGGIQNKDSPRPRLPGHTAEPRTAAPGSSHPFVAFNMGNLDASQLVCMPGQDTKPAVRALGP